MADYITTAQLQSYGSFSGVAGEAILDLIVPAACLAIDNYCGRHFESTVETDHTFTRYVGGYASEPIDGRILLLDDDLAAVPSVISDSPVVAYLPQIGPPYYAMVLVTGAWSYPTVTVTGHWAYSTTPPADIVIAALQLAKWMYDQRETNEGTNVLITPEGQILLPTGLPNFIRTLLDPYRKLRLA